MREQMTLSLSALRQLSPALLTATGLAVSLALAFAASSAHAQGSRNPIAQEFSSQYLPKNLPGPHLAKYFPQE